MLTNQRWLKSNLQSVVNGFGVKFETMFMPYQFKPISFHQAAEYTANLIRYSYNQELCLGLSGGADSEYIARLLHSMKIKFLPVIIDYPGNEEEIKRAYALCYELGLSPQSIPVTEHDIIKYYIQNTYQCYRNDGLNHTFQLMVVDYAQKLNLIAILGETHIFDPNPNKSIMRAFKFLPDLYYSSVVPFYYYTIELTFAEMIEIKDGETAAAFKARIRETQYREKIFPQYSHESYRLYQNCVASLNPQTLAHDMGTPSDFIKSMEVYIK